MKEYYANAVAKLAVVSNRSGEIMNQNELFPGAYRVETYMGDDGFMKFLVFESEEEYVWYKLRT